MADKTIKVKVETEVDVQPTIAELKKLKLQIKETSDPAEFKKLTQQYNDMEDAIKSARTGANNFVEVLGTLPGPIGNIGSALGGTLQSLKQFGSLKFTDIKGSFVELGKDVVDVGKGIGNLTGLTKLYEFSVSGLTKTMTALGIAEQGAAVAAQRLSGALIATGIGALVVAVGYLIANFDELTESIFGTTAAEKAYNAVNEQAVKTSGELIVNETALIQKIQKGGLTRQEQIHVLNEWNAKHKDTNLLFNDYKKLQDYVVASGPQYIEYIKAKAKADANYSLILLKQKELLETQVKSPAEFRKWYDYFSDQAIFGKIGDVDLYRKNVMASKLNVEIDALAANTDKLTKEASAAAAKAGVVSTEKFVPTTTTTTPTGPKGETAAQKAARLKKEAEAIQAELDKVADAAYAKSLKDRDRELYEAGGRYNTLLIKAKQHGLDTTAATEAYRQEEVNINKKYDESDAKTKADDDKKKLDDDKVARKAEFEKAKADLDLQRAQKLIDEDTYQTNLEALKIKYAESEVEKINAQVDKLNYLNEEKDKSLERDKERAKEQEEINRQVTQSWIDLGNNIGNTFQQLAGLFEQGSDMAKTFGIISVLINAAAAIGKINLDFAEAISTKTKTIAQATATVEQGALLASNPFTAAIGLSMIGVGTSIGATASAGLGILRANKALQIASVGITSGAQIAAILSAKKGASATGSSSGGSGGAGASTPPPSYGGAAVGMAAPQIQTTGGMNPTTQIAQTLGNAQAPIRAYVVSGEISSAQALDRRTSRAATLS